MEDDNGLPKKSKRDSDPDDVAAGKQVHQSDRTDTRYPRDNT